MQIMLENVKKSAHSSSMHFLSFLFHNIVSRHVEVIFHRSIFADVKVKVTFTLIRDETVMMILPKSLVIL